MKSKVIERLESKLTNEIIKLVDETADNLIQHNKKMKPKRISYHTEEFLTKVIQKQLDLHGATYEEIKSLSDGKLPNGEFWYQHYKFNTKEQHAEWKLYCIEELRNSRERLTKKKAEQVFMWIDLQWGLKHQWEHEELTANTK